MIVTRDLARLYECINSIKNINKAVKRNIEKFQENFMFQLTNEEYDNLKFQFGTSKDSEIKLLKESFSKIEEK